MGKEHLSSSYLLPVCAHVRSLKVTTTECHLTGVTGIWMRLNVIWDVTSLFIRCCCCYGTSAADGRHVGRCRSSVSNTVEVLLFCLKIPIRERTEGASYYACELLLAGNEAKVVKIRSFNSQTAPHRLRTNYDVSQAGTASPRGKVVYLLLWWVEDVWITLGGRTT